MIHSGDLTRGHATVDQREARAGYDVGAVQRGADHVNRTRALRLALSRRLGFGSALWGGDDRLGGDAFALGVETSLEVFEACSDDEGLWGGAVVDNGMVLRGG